MKNRFLGVRKSSFVEGTVVATLSIVISKVLGMFYVIPFYAMIGSIGSALYSYAYNIYVIFLDISSAGLPIAMSKIINEYNTLGRMDAKERAYKLAKKIMISISIVLFLFLILFAPMIAEVLLGDLSGGNTVEDVVVAIRCVTLAILVVPSLAITKGYLQGHNIIGVSSFSQVVEQVVRIVIILGGTYVVLYVLKGSVTEAVCVSVMGAAIGGVVAYLFLKKKEKFVDKGKDYPKDPIQDRDIIKKIVRYAVPFIIINVISSCYNFIDMTLLLRTMNKLGMEVGEVEFVTSAVTTWAPKINMVVTSIAMGMSTSFIPTMVEAYTLKDYKEINKRFNQAIQMLLFVSLPMVIGISILCGPIWTLFYGYNRLGTIILSLNVFMGLFINIFMITSSALQGLSKFKLVYKVTILGFFTNALLDVPLMILYNRLGIPAFLGAITASIIGYSLSIFEAFRGLKKECKLEYREIIHLGSKLVVPILGMILVVFLLYIVVPFDVHSRISSLLFVSLSSIMGALVYLGLSLKLGIIGNIFGEFRVNRVIKKLTFGKLSI